MRSYMLSHLSLHAELVYMSTLIAFAFFASISHELGIYYFLGALHT